VDASSWIAAASAGIAALAFVVSGRALQIQRTGAAISIRQEFDELVRQLWLALGKSMGDAENSRLGPAELSRAADLAGGEIQTLALRADEILYPEAEGDGRTVWYWRWTRIWRPSSERPQPSWFDANVLASSFAEVWDLERARRYWQRAVALAARESPITQVLTLRDAGRFYYIDSTDSGLKIARDAFSKAASILQPEIHGTDLAYYQNSVTLFIQAQEEDGLDNIELASHYLCEAWELAANIRVFWRRRQAKSQIAAFIASAKSDINDPERSARYDGLPQEIMQEVDKLRIQQSAAAPWPESFNAGQQQAFIPPPPAFIPPPPPLVLPPPPGPAPDGGAAR